MDSPTSCLNGSHAPVVADTSVVINLNDSRRSDVILDVLPNRFLLVEQVLWELEAGRSDDYLNFDSLSVLIARGKAEVVELVEPETRIDGSFVNTVTDGSLGNGEAATIAFAQDRGEIALVDDRKAVRIGAERFGDLSLGFSLDLLAQRDVKSTLGCQGLNDAIVNAVYVGRMRVPTEWVGWVVNVIGRERASMCSSLTRQLRQLSP